MNELAESILTHLLRGGVLLAMGWGGWLLLRGLGRGYWHLVLGLLLGMGLLAMAPALQVFSVSLPEPPSLPFRGAERFLPVMEVPIVTEVAAEPAGSSMNLAGALVSLWLAGALFLAIRFGRGWWLAERLKRTAHPIPHPDVNLAWHPSLPSPVSIGKTILVPADFPQWPVAEQRMAIAHELSHIRSRDGFWKAFGHILAVVHWPNPLLWLALRQLDRDRELAADRAVLAAGNPARGYAELLIRLAAKTPSPRSLLAMARPSTVPARVNAILSRQSQSGKTLPKPLLIGGIAVLALGALTLGLTTFGNRNREEKALPANSSKPANANLQVYVSVKFVEVSREKADKLGLGTFTNGGISPSPGLLRGVLTDPQFQTILRQLHETGAKLLSSPNVMARSGQRTLVEVGDLESDFTATIGKDGYTIDLELREKVEGKTITTTVTIWDGQTVVKGSPAAQPENVILKFETAAIIDPTGQPTPES